MEYIPSEIYVNGNPEATWSNLLDSALLFRMGTVVGILVHLSFILLPLTLYKLLQHVHRNAAVLMVVFALISVPISYPMLLDQISIIDHLRSPDSLSPRELENAKIGLSVFYERLYNGFFISQVFWGLWLFPFGYLVFKSGFIPKTLGVFLMLGCITYLIDVFGAILFPAYYDYIDTSLLIIPAAIGEIGSCLWLLFIGVKGNVRF
jgi:hypothetical protein